MINNVTIHGRLTRDPERRMTQTGKAVCPFTVASDTGFGDKKKANYIDCVAWEGTAEILCNYFAKGQEILVHGSLQTREYTDRQGQNRKATEVQVREIDFCGPKRQSVDRAPAYRRPTGKPEEYEELLDEADIPFE